MPFLLVYYRYPVSKKQQQNVRVGPQEPSGAAILRAAFDRLRFNSYGKPSLVGADDALLAEVEAIVGSPLPADYRWFLQNYGAGWVSSEESDDEWQALDVAHFARLFGAATQPQPCAHSILWALRDFEYWLRPDEIPIGDDRFQYPLVLDVVTGVVSKMDYDQLDRRIDLGTESFTALVKSQVEQAGRVQIDWPETEP